MSKRAKARKFNHLTIDTKTGILTKTSEDKDKFIGEILWYLRLPAKLRYVSPTIYDYSTDYENPFVSMEYFSYKTLHELYLYDNFDRSQWTSIFTAVKNVCDDFKKYTISNEDIVPSLKSMYLDKTVNRLNRLRGDSRFERYFTEDITINGITYKSLNEIIDLLQKLIPEYLYDVREFNIIHGDLCFSNMMIDNSLSFLKLIDPRGKFGKFDIYGDFRYELAKLMHSVDGQYDFIIKDMFNLTIDGNKIFYSVNKPTIDFNLYELFAEIFKEEINGDLKKIELIESLVFLSMIPLHEESFDHQVAMMVTGIQILDRVVDIKVN